MGKMHEKNRYLGKKYKQPKHFETYHFIFAYTSNQRLVYKTGMVSGGCRLSPPLNYLAVAPVVPNNVFNVTVVKILVTQLTLVALI